MFASGGTIVWQYSPHSDGWMHIQTTANTALVSNSRPVRSVGHTATDDQVMGRSDHSNPDGVDTQDTTNYFKQ